jgi:phosphate transport system substrate-binding protein
VRGLSVEVKMSTGTGTEPVKRPGRRLWPIILGLVVIVVAIVGVFAYVYLTSTPAVAIQGTGATFPAPLIQNWTITYHNLYSNTTINYNSLGSGAGIAVITNQTVDFGASDAPLSDAQLAAAPGLTLFPETLGGVAITYNLPSSSVPSGTQLNFTSTVISQIYNGTITNWNDGRIQSINPGVTLPNTSITTVHRSDGSGTTYAFTNYLSVSEGWWSAHVGFNTKVTWPNTPLTAAGSGNSGVAGDVKNTVGAIGYVDVIYAVNNNLGVGQVKNQAGNYIAPTLQTILWAAGNGTSIISATDLRQHIVNAAGAQSYPIATYTYILIYKDLSTNKHTTKAVAYQLARFLWWIIGPVAQAKGPGLIYAQLPTNIVSADQTLLRTLNWSGQQIITW